MRRSTVLACLLLTSCAAPDVVPPEDVGAEVEADTAVADATPEAPSDAPACSESDVGACPAPSEPACAKAVCRAGVCAIEPSPSGTALPDARQKAGDCRRLVCDGKGAVTSEPADDPPPEEPCIGHACVAGAITSTPKAKGLACSGGVCVEGACVPATCLDALVDGDESDVDCGGSCAPCAVGKACGGPKDCASASCKAGVCAGPACDDGVKNGTETDVDCGGGCKACPDGKACTKATDCLSATCTAGLCVAPTCDDGVLNGTEADVDCGGTCAPCKAGAKCGATKDCASGVCAKGLCAAPSCSDGVRNGDESDTDCGGSACAGCKLGSVCTVSADCSSKWCSGGVCTTPTCTDGARNGAETDVDCGGGCPSTCALTKGCSVDGDCASGACYFGRCTRPFFRLEGARAYQGGSGLDAVFADFDGDGDLDIVKTDGGFLTYWLSLYPNDKGVLGAPVTIALTAPLTSLATGDFDGDGRPDLVGVSRASTYGYLGEIHVLLNAGGGTFKPPVVYKLTDAVRVMAADLNGDGRADVVATSATGDGAVFLADPAGKLVLKQSLASSGSSILAIGDVDGDGDRDVIVAHASGYSTVFANAGDGSFTAKGTIPTNLAVDGMDMQLADFDEDGLPDLLFYNTVYFELYRNGGPAGFKWTTTITPSPDRVSGWTIADVNRDGHLDVVYSAIDHDTILLGDGKEGFPGKRILPRGNDARFLRFATMDADCRPDLVRVNGYGRNDITYAGDDKFATARRAGLAGYDWTVADADGDGRLDLFSIYEDELLLSLNDGLWSPDATKAKSMKVTPSATAIVTFDLDGDKKPEVAIVDRAADKLHIASLKGGVWDAASLKTFTTTLRPLSLVAADFDRDGREDLFLVGNDDYPKTAPLSQVYWNKPTGLVAETLPYGGSRVAAADLDGDGWIDLAIVGAAHSGDEASLYVVWNDSGKFAKVDTLSVVGGTVALGDVDGDGRVDVAFTSGGEEVGVLRNLGARKFATTATLYRTQVGPYGVALVDLDGDGRLDLVVNNTIAESVSVLRNRGGIFAPAESWKGGFTAGVHSTDWSSPLRVADMDGDGLPDVVQGTFPLMLKNLAGTPPPPPCGPCGDGKRTFPEVCDDGNSTAGDGCSACNLDLGWTCSGTSCAPICGDRVMAGKEACDDGNATGGDGCSASCAIETGWTCSVATPGVVSKCLATCGDGKVVGYELCDDGNVLDGDSCPSTCRRDLWVRRLGDTGKQVGTAVTSDATGSWVIGTFTGTLDFGAAGSLTASTSSVQEGFLARISDEGIPTVARKLSGYVEPSKVTGDGAGNVYVVGVLHGLGDLGGGSVGAAGNNAFVTKYDASGTHVWSKVFAASGASSSASAVTASATGVTLGGRFEGSLSFGCATLTAAGSKDAFVATLDSTGSCVRSLAFGGSGYDEVTALAQGAGAVFVGGTFEGTVSFGATSLVAKGAPDLYVLRLDGATVTWAKRYGQNNVYEALPSLVWDGTGLVMGGTFETDIDFGTGLLSTAGGTDVFVARLDGAGTATLAKRFGDAANQTLSGLAVDVAGQVILSGLLEGTVDFGGVSLAAKSLDDTYVVKLASDGSGLWGTSIAAGRGGAVACTTSSRRVNLVGYANAAVSFGPTTYLPRGDSDVLLVSLAP